jgi:hypothetical protein
MSIFKNVALGIKNADFQRAVNAMPVGLGRLPREGAEVRFWTVSRLEPEKTVIGNSMVGIFRRGGFWNGSDHWSVNEVTHYVPLTHSV